MCGCLRSVCLCLIVYIDLGLCIMFFLILLCLCMFFYFFFSSRRRHTRSYGDWSSDVCSSDLCPGGEAVRLRALRAPGPAGRNPDSQAVSRQASGASAAVLCRPARAADGLGHGSEERRVGKECRSGWGREDVKERRKRGKGEVE